MCYINPDPAYWYVIAPLGMSKLNMLKIRLFKVLPRIVRCLLPIVRNNNWTKRNEIRKGKGKIATKNKKLYKSNAFSSFLKYVFVWIWTVQGQSILPIMVCFWVFSYVIGPIFMTRLEIFIKTCIM